MNNDKAGGAVQAQPIPEYRRFKRVRVKSPEELEVLLLNRTAPLYAGCYCKACAKMGWNTFIDATPDALLLHSKEAWEVASGAVPGKPSALFEEVRDEPIVKPLTLIEPMPAEVYKNLDTHATVYVASLAEITGVVRMPKYLANKFYPDALPRGLVYATRVGALAKTESLLGMRLEVRQDE